MTGARGRIEGDGMTDHDVSALSAVTRAMARAEGKMLVISVDEADALASLEQELAEAKQERDAEILSREMGNEILGEIVVQIEAATPMPEDQPCKCGHCRHSRGVTRLVARVRELEAIIEDGVDQLRRECVEEHVMRGAYIEEIRRAEAAELALDAATKALREIVVVCEAWETETDEDIAESVEAIARAALAAREDTP